MANAARRDAVSGATSGEVSDGMSVVVSQQQPHQDLRRLILELLHHPQHNNMKQHSLPKLV